MLLLWMGTGLQGTIDLELRWRLLILAWDRRFGESFQVQNQSCDFSFMYVFGCFEEVIVVLGIWVTYIGVKLLWNCVQKLCLMTFEGIGLVFGKWGLKKSQKTEPWNLVSCRSAPVPISVCISCKVSLLLLLSLAKLL